jgi:hypothetical protein
LKYTITYDVAGQVAGVTIKANRYSEYNNVITFYKVKEGKDDIKMFSIPVSRLITIMDDKAIVK